MTRIAPDANDVFVMRLNETTGPVYANSGSIGSSGNWNENGGSVVNVQGLFDNAMYIPSSYISNNHDGAGGGNEVVISPNLSISGWIFLRRYTNYFAEVFNKQYFLGGWSSPFLTFGFQMQSTNDGSIELYITLNGTLQVIRSGGSWPVPLGRWSHIGATWDGSTMKMYINGNFVTSGAFSGSIDYGTTGNRGQWYVGAIPTGSTLQSSPIIVQDVRIANVVRPQSYFANIYFNGSLTT